MVARKLIAVITMALCSLVGMLALLGGAASAAFVHEPVGTFGVNGTGTGSFSDVQSIAIDEASGSVYVYDVGTGSIYKYTTAGEPAEFSSLKATAISNVGGSSIEGVTAIAVDNSSGPAKGDIYVASFETVTVYNAAGQRLGELDGAGHPSGLGPCGVAVDPSGNLYVGMYHEHVNKYTPTTNLVKDSDYVSTLYTNNVCHVAADPNGHVYTLGWTGGGENEAKQYSVTEFSALESFAFGTGVSASGRSMTTNGSNGDLYVASEQGPGLYQYSRTGARLGVTPLQGASIAVGVDAGTGDLYVADKNSERIEMFGPDIAVPDVATGEVSEIEPTTATLNGDVNPGGMLVTSCQFEYGTSTVYEHTVPCTPEPGSGSGEVPVTAHLSGLQEGVGYHYRLKAANANAANATLDATFTTHGRPAIRGENASVVTLTTATLEAEVDPQGVATTYRFEYGTDTSYGTTVPIPDASIGSGTSYQNVSVPISGLRQGTTYYYRVVATNSLGEVFGANRGFITEPAVRIVREASVDDRITTARLLAEIGPQGVDTTYQFEYGTSTSYGSSVPVPGATISAANGTNIVTVSSEVNGLSPGTIYHFRVTATNSHGTNVGADRVFSTAEQPKQGAVDSCSNADRRVGAAANLPDCRAYEMVSPLDKNGSDIGGAGRFSTHAAIEGERASFIAGAGFADAISSGNDGVTTYIASRGGSGWSTHSLTPLSWREEDGVNDGTQVEGFTEDLQHELWFGIRVPGAELGTGGINYYRGTTQTGALETITTPSGSEQMPELFDLSPVGFSSDMGVLAFQSTRNFLPETAGGAPKLYAWEHGILRLAGILPDGAVPAGGSKYPGSVGGLIANQGSVSSHGSRVLFVSPTVGSAPQQLYMRLDGSRTVWVSRPETSVASPEPRGVSFQAASSDGRKIVFASETPLLDSDPGGGGKGLYVYSDSPDPETEANLTFVARVGGERELVVGMSEDASRIYYNGNGGVYLWDKGTVHLVANMKPLEKAGDYGMDVRVSADGRRLAFVTAPYLSGESELAKPATGGDVGVDEHHPGFGRKALYLYDEGSETVRCVSCPANGEAMGSNAEVAPSFPRGGIIGGLAFLSRYLSSDGKRLFFNSADALVPQDTNGLPDVYEYDVEKGQVKLLSSGTGESPSLFEDASGNGNDVFFITAQKLTGWDTDTLVDLYDARVNGGFTEPPAPPAVCEGDACQGLPGAVPAFNTASGFAGLGNQSNKPVTSTKTIKKKPKKKHGHNKRKHRRKAKKSGIHVARRTGR